MTEVAGESGFEVALNHARSLCARLGANPVAIRADNVALGDLSQDEFRFAATDGGQLETLLATFRYMIKVHADRWECTAAVNARNSLSLGYEFLVHGPSSQVSLPVLGLELWRLPAPVIALVGRLVFAELAGAASVAESPTLYFPTALFTLAIKRYGDRFRNWWIHEIIASRKTTRKEVVGNV